MAYDSAVNAVVLFGGLDSTGLNTLDDTWEFNGSGWAPVSPSAPPPARSYAAMGYDPSTNQVVLFGGLDTSSNTLGDEWTYNASTLSWTAQTTAALPSARSDTSMVYDTASSQFVLFGGLDPNVNTSGRHLDRERNVLDRTDPTGPVRRVDGLRFGIQPSGALRRARRELEHAR